MINRLSSKDDSTSISTNSPTLSSDRSTSSITYSFEQEADSLAQYAERVVFFSCKNKKTSILNRLFAFSAGRSVDFIEKFKT